VKRAEPILKLTPTGDGAAFYRTLARVLVRNAIAELYGVGPKDPALRAEAARTERPRVSDKRLATFEVMTAGELARYLDMDVMRIYAHVERNTIPHQRVGEHLRFSRRAVVQWLADGEPSLGPDQH
jgi:excisionase family DNA binding protein